MHYLYILVNKNKTRAYTGVTDDVPKRLCEHNKGRVKSSRPFRPYQVVHTERFQTLAEARKKEKFFKSSTGRRKLKALLLNCFLKEN